MARIQFFLKRFFDYSFSALLLICSSPFTLLSILVVKICSPESPVFFKQTRIGQYGKEFTLYKLRTMTNERDENGELLPDEERLKLWGKIIRRANFDEIPQVVNVFKNNMSLIGPRPLLAHEMEIFTPEEQKVRQSVLPGITGWEAVNEASATTRREKGILDLYYVSNWSLGLDIKIFFLTVFVIFGNRRPDDAIRAPKMEEETIAK